MAKVHSYLQHELMYRGDDVLAKRCDAKILLCGAGALGSWLADLLARQGYRNLVLLDMGFVGDENFGTQNYGSSDVGRSKAFQTTQNVYRRVGVSIQAIKRKLHADNAHSLVRKYALVVDLFDNAESRGWVRQACLDENVACLHAGLAAMGFFEVRWNEGYIVPSPRKDDDADPPCEYPLAANLVTMCVGATAEAINRFIDSGSKINVEFWLNSMSLEIMS